MDFYSRLPKMPDLNALPCWQHVKQAIAHRGLGLVIIPFRIEIPICGDSAR
jgi:hypothetical protein